MINENLDKEFKQMVKKDTQKSQQELERLEQLEEQKSNKLEKYVGENNKIDSFK